MSGGVAVVKVGAATETELKKKWNSIIEKDALRLVQPLKKVVAGGGTALVNVISAVATPWSGRSGLTGRNIVLRALENQFINCSQCWLRSPLWLIAWKCEAGTRLQCCNRLNGWIMIDAGIIDLLESVVQPFKTAASVANLFNNWSSRSQQTKNQQPSRTRAWWVGWWTLSLWVLKHLIELWQAPWCPCRCLTSSRGEVSFLHFSLS